MFERIKRIIEWIPILWKTHDWDHTYMTQIWAYSLKRLRTCIVNGYGVVTKTRLRKLDTAIILLERLSQDHDYTDKHLDHLIKKYGPLTIPGLGRDNPWPKEGIKELRQLYKLEEMLYNQDMDLLHKILKTQLRRWWE